MALAEQIVSFLYRKNLHRSPEEGGLKFWAGKIEAGHTVEEIDTAISHSEEALAYNK